MARKWQLSKMHKGAVLNGVSKRQDSEIMRAVCKVSAALRAEYGKIKIVHSPIWKLNEIINRLNENFPDVSYCKCRETSLMKPDGGILSIEDKNGMLYPVLISEKKNQGTNDIRAKKGKPKQARGNAIERLGKNVIGLRAAMLNESIFPFVCFGDGCDFSEGSSIVDRVKTIAMFGSLNEVHLHNEGPGGIFNRGTYFFREKEWKRKEMYEIMLDIARRSILYYFSKYSKESFVR